MRRSGPLRRRTPLRRAARRRIPPDVRAALVLRSRARCESGGFSPLCRGTGAHAHHVLRRSQGGDDSLANLRWLCGPCHHAVHAAPARARVAGLLVRRPTP